MKKWLKPIVALATIAVLIILARWYGLDQQLNDFKEWVKDQGALGPIIFIGVYALSTVLALPGSALTIMAGAIFGSFIGTSTVIIGATLGASLCFLISRYFARDWIAGLLAKNDKFKKLDSLTEKNGAIIVAITRLVPLFPFNLLNYGFGLTNVSFSTYILWSFICMFPGTILFVVGTDAITTTLREGTIPWMLIAVVVLAIGILTVIVRKAKSKLKD